MNLRTTLFDIARAHAAALASEAPKGPLQGDLLSGAWTPPAIPLDPPELPESYWAELQEDAEVCDEPEPVRNSQTGAWEWPA